MCPLLSALGSIAVGNDPLVGGPDRARPDCTQGSKCRRLADKEAGRDRTSALGRNVMIRRVPRGTLLAATLALLATTALAQQPQDAPAQAPAPAATPAPAPAPAATPAPAPAPAPAPVAAA